MCWLLCDDYDDDTPTVATTTTTPRHSRDKRVNRKKNTQKFITEKCHSFFHRFSSSSPVVAFVAVIKIIVDRIVENCPPTKIILHSRINKKKITNDFIHISPSKTSSWKRRLNGARIVKLFNVQYDGLSGHLTFQFHFFCFAFFINIFFYVILDCFFWY